ncbi:MAG: alanine--glyoxylate aminotransferase family protein [Thermaerobacter sp.]|nr:alanine--glyoxylate aminotransferase family protein [Thermaerobacter sp.]
MREGEEGMQQNQLLMIPGPTYVPPRILSAMSAPMINHRGPEFQAMYREVQEGLRTVFGAQGDLVIYPSAGTGGLEAAVANFFSPGDRVLAVTVGVFGDRFATIAERFGLQVERLTEEWGRAADPDRIARRLAEDRTREIKGILLTHNETSTGVANPLREIARVREGHPALLLVDAVSSLGALELKAQEWELDVVAVGSQKALMIPPGLAILALSPRAWQAAEEARLPRFYWDVLAYRKNFEKQSTPYTPAVPQWYALREALRMVAEEGLPAVYERHALLGEMTRSGVQALGLSLLAEAGRRSDTVTAVRVPPGVAVGRLRQALREDYGVVVAGGQGKLAEEVFRIGHLGCISPMDILSTLAALELALSSLGHPVHLGDGVAAAQKVLAGRKAR